VNGSAGIYFLIAWSVRRGGKVGTVRVGSRVGHVGDVGLGGGGYVLFRQGTWQVEAFDVE
jgi:hypothetical protein